MRYVLASALFLMLAGGLSMPLLAQDAPEKEDQTKEAEAVQPTTYKAGISGMR
jgi:hypothetical protein